VENAFLRLTIGVFVFLAAAAFVAAGTLGAKGIEKRLQSRADSAIEGGEFDWAQVRADGATIRLSGVAPSDGDRISAIDALSNLGARRIDVSAASATKIEDERAAAIPEPAPVIETSSASREIIAVNAETVEECRKALRNTLNEQRITFKLESASLSDAARAILDDLAVQLLPCEGLSIDVEGHTDTAGPSYTNLRLSERRAYAVAQYIAPRAPETKFSVKAYGETRPIASNRTLEGRRANRRIEFALSEKDAESESPSP